MEHRGDRTGVAAPVRRDGGVWGAVLAATTDGRELPDDAEDRLGRFAELVASAPSATEDRRVLEERTAEHAALRRVAAAG